MPEETSNQKHTALFFQLVLTFQSAAWQQMGKVKNPITDKIEKNLDQARFSIDMLEMLQAKTKGNLSTDEESFLKRSISELQLNYIAEADKPQSEGEADSSKDDKTDSEDEKKDGDVDGEAPDKSKQDPKTKAESIPDEKA